MRRGLPIVWALALGLVLAEGAVRLLERLGRLGPQRRPAYDEAYQAKAFRKDLGPGGMLAEGFRGQVSDEYGRPVEWINNSAGFRSRREYAPAPPPGVARLLVLGDSFVAGHRVGQDDTFGALLESWLNASGRFPGGAEVLLSAIEQPVLGLHYLETRGIGWKPHTVLLGLTLGNDVGQAYFALGEHGRFRLLEAPVPAEAVLASNTAFDNEAALAQLKSQLIPARCASGRGGQGPSPRRPANGESRLHLVRLARSWWRERRERLEPQASLSTWGIYGRPLLFDGNGLGLYLTPIPPEIERAYERLEAVLRGYQQVCTRAGLRLAVVLFAQRFQVQPQDWEATVAAYGLERSCFDLEVPSRRIAEICRRHAITLVDPTAAMAERHARSGVNFYMPHGDMHWNRAGQRVVFDLIRDDVAALLEDAARPGEPQSIPPR